MLFKTFLFVLFVSFLSIFVYVKVQVDGDINNNFNQTTRFRLGKNQWARKVFSLHNQGDARAEYILSSRPIVLEIVRSQSARWDDVIPENLAKKFSEILGQPVQLFFNDYAKEGILGQGEIDSQITQKRRHVLSGQPNFFVLYIQDYKGRDNELAKNYKEFGTIISENGLVEATKYNRAKYSQYLESVILHQFGSQIGLKENNDSNCIMNNQLIVQDSNGHFFRGSIIPQDFCENEKQAVRAIKDSL